MSIWSIFNKKEKSEGNPVIPDDDFIRYTKEITTLFWCCSLHLGEPGIGDDEVMYSTALLYLYPNIQMGKIKGPEIVSPIKYAITSAGNDFDKKLLNVINRTLEFLFCVDYKRLGIKKISEEVNQRNDLISETITGVMLRPQEIDCFDDIMCIAEQNMTDADFISVVKDCLR